MVVAWFVSSDHICLGPSNTRANGRSSNTEYLGTVGLFRWRRGSCCWWGGWDLSIVCVLYGLFGGTTVIGLAGAELLTVEAFFLGFVTLFTVLE